MSMTVWQKHLRKSFLRCCSTLLVSIKDRGGIPFHIIIEEAHRYVQKDADEEILGYNIFDRITKRRS